MLGAITLNRAVGGLNALAVEIAAREGARTVWFPTVNSVNEQHEVHPAPPGATVPVWVAFELELREAGHRADPVAVVDADGGLLPQALEVLAVIAHHDMVLATGHLARDEIFALVEQAAAVGVRQIVVTHPEFRRSGSRSLINWRWRSAARCSSAASPRPTPVRCPGS